MKLFVYCFREFDEKEAFDALKEKYCFEYDYSAEYPSHENAYLAAGYDAISFTPCTMDASLIDAFYELGVRYIAARSIGFDHIDLQHAEKIGMGVSHVSYEPDTVADYAILLMLMGCRKVSHILKRSELQDYSAARQNRQGYQRLHRWYYWQRQNWLHGNPASFRIWLYATGL